MRHALLTILVVGFGIVPSATVFGGTTYTWTGAGDGTTFANSLNWSPNGVPSGAGGTPDTAQWDGLTSSNLLITMGATALPGTGFGSVGIHLVLTTNQTNTVQLISSVSVSGAMAICNITNNSPDSSLILGDGTTQLLNVVTRPAGALHHFINNSAAPAILNGSILWSAGGGTAYALEFGGAGDWIVNSYLKAENGPPTILWDGPGTMYWGLTNAYNAFNPPLGPIAINDGTMILESAGLVASSQAVTSFITNNGALIFNESSQVEAVSRNILGAGVLQVNSGTLILTGPNTYTGNTVLNGGELIADSAESGISGPLGVAGTIMFDGGTLGFSVTNVFDYSGRFATTPGQAYSIDTGGLNVAFTNATGLSSSGGTLGKLGAGTLTLAAASTYSGATTVTAGKLVFQGPKAGDGDIRVADGAALGTTATSSQITPGTLTLGTASGVTLEFNNLNSTTIAPLAAGTLAANAVVTFNFNSGLLSPGQSYPLLTWTNGSPPAINVGIVNGGSGYFSTNGNSIQFNVPSISGPTLTFALSANGMQFTWTGNFKLQAQTNNLAAGLGTNWFDYPGGATSGIVVPVGVGNGAVFFRLAQGP